MKLIVSSLFLIVITVNQTSPMALDYLNQFKDNRFQQSAVPRQSNYHIDSRFKLNETDQSIDPPIKLLFQNGLNQKNQVNQSTISLLPWEEDSWQYFTTTTIKSTTNSIQPSVIINQPSSSSTTLPTTIKQIISSPLPWEEDYGFNFAPNQISSSSTVKPSDSTTIKSTTLNTISTTSAAFPEHFIFNLIPLKPIINISDPNWPKFPVKKPTI